MEVKRIEYSNRDRKIKSTRTLLHQRAYWDIEGSKKKKFNQTELINHTKIGRIQYIININK